MRATIEGGKSPGPPQQQNRKLWERLITTVVVENTQPSPSQDATRKLLKYLSNPQTVDIVYEKIIERVNTSKAQIQQVLPVVVKLLKTHLTQHVPTKDTLHKLDLFCIALKSDSPTVSKSIQFVRNLIKKELSPLRKLGGSGGSDTKPLAVVSGPSVKTETLNYPKSPVPEKHAPHGHTTPSKGRNNGTLATRESELDLLHKGAATDGGKLSNSGGSPDHHHHHAKGLSADREKPRDNSRELVADLLALNASQCDATLPIEDVSLATASVFGGQLRRLSASVGPKGSDVSDDLRIHDPEAVRNHTKIVSMAKKQEEQQLYKRAGLVTLRRKGVQLFQYIYYKDQLPLILPPDEMEQVVNSVVSSPLEDHESCLIASKILIKLLVDMYCSDGEAASRLLLSLLFEMLESPQTHTKVHAFNLLWNLSIHMNLLEEIATLPEEGGEAGRNTDAYKRIQAIQEDLFAVVKEMLLFLVLKGEKDDKVWSAGLNCKLFFITSQGRIDKVKLYSLDPRILPAIISNVETLSDEMYRHLMRCVVNMLYTDKQELNVKLLLRACPGGISWIIRHYVRCRCDIVRGNLFTILFHYILYKIKRTKKQKAAMILQLLASVHAPLYFTQLFKAPPPNFVKDFMSFMQDQLQIAPSFPPAAAPSGAGGTTSLTGSSGQSAATSAPVSTPSSGQSSTTTTPPNTPHQSAQHTPPPSPSTSYSTSPLLTASPSPSPSGSGGTSLSLSTAAATGASSLGLSSGGGGGSASGSGSTTPALGASGGSSSNANSSGAAAAAASGGASGSSLSLSSGSMSPLATLSAAAISKLVETKLLEMVLVGFHKLATDHLKLEPEYAARVNEVAKLDLTQPIEPYLRGLFDLLDSSSPAERWQGELWLYELMQLTMEGRKNSLSEQQQGAVKELFHGLLASENPRVRRVYSSITERLLHSLKAQLREPARETSLTEVFRLLNDNLGRVVASGEKDVANLLLVLDVIFNVITYRADMATSASHGDEGEMYRDRGGDQYDEFLNGRITISHQLLKRVDIKVLVYLSVHLPRSNLISSVNDAKVTTLIMIIHKCTKEPEALEAIGGVSFFKKLLVETNPQIAYHASRFIIEQLRRERPEQYQAIFKQLLQRAQVTKDEKLLSNYYLQVISIIEMNTVHNKALGTARRTARAPPALGTTRRG